MQGVQRTCQHKVNFWLATWKLCIRMLVIIIIIMKGSAEKGDESFFVKKWVLSFKSNVSHSSHTSMRTFEIFMQCEYFAKVRFVRSFFDLRILNLPLLERPAVATCKMESNWSVYSSSMFPALLQASVQFLNSKGTRDFGITSNGKGKFWRRVVLPISIPFENAYYCVKCIILYWACAPPPVRRSWRIHACMYMYSASLYVNTWRLIQLHQQKRSPGLWRLGHSVGHLVLLDEVTLSQLLCFSR